MNQRIQANRQFLSDLFAGPFRGHAIVMDPADPPPPDFGDFTTSTKPLTDWCDWQVECVENRLKWHDTLEDDQVPSAILPTGTQIFAAAFGCPVHIYEDTPPAARPLVRTAQEADALMVPALDAGPLAKVWELGHILREKIGPDIPLRVPDIQSPFDIAALIWNKEDFFVAMIETPASVMELVAKCNALLTAFLMKFKEEFGEISYCHCPNAWAPPEQGMWLSEDEAGSLSVGMFEEFCLPVLNELSATFGGIFIHCCATADHQYASLNKIANLRGMNRVFQSPGPRPAVEAFAGKTVLVQSWMLEKEINAMLDMALPDSRFLLNMPWQPLDQAKATFLRLRERCPRLS